MSNVLSHSKIIHILGRLLLLLCLSGCGSLSKLASEPVTEAQINLPTDQRFSSFDQASLALKNRLEQLGYDTMEGDHAIGNAESYVAESSDTDLVSVRVNTAWQTTEPLGSYKLMDNSKKVKSGSVIARLDATGVWVVCGKFQFELLSTGPIVEMRRLQLVVEEQMGC